MSEKFLPKDQEAVVGQISRIQRTTLKPVPPSRKFFVDTDGKFYCVFGGTGDWHGISGNLMNHLRSHQTNTLLVIAKKYRTRIDICVGVADKLAQSEANL